MLKERKGSEIDFKNLKNLFESLNYNFTVWLDESIEKIKENEHFKEALKRLNEIKDEIEDSVDNGIEKIKNHEKYKEAMEKLEKLKENVEQTFEDLK